MKQVVLLVVLAGLVLAGCAPATASAPASVLEEPLYFAPRFRQVAAVGNPGKATLFRVVKDTRTGTCFIWSWSYNTQAVGSYLPPEACARYERLRKE